jgi:hypothetical protein
MAFGTDDLRADWTLRVVGEPTVREGQGYVGTPYSVELALEPRRPIYPGFNDEFKKRSNLSGHPSAWASNGTVTVNGVKPETVGEVINLVYDVVDSFNAGLAEARAAQAATDAAAPERERRREEALKATQEAALEAARRRSEQGSG